VQLGLHPSSSTKVVRSCAAIALAFVTFARASSLIGMRSCDIELSLPTTLKATFIRNKHRAVHDVHIVHYTAASPIAYDILRLVDKWRRVRPQLECLWGLPSEQQIVDDDAARVTAWVSSITSKLDLHPPQGLAYTSHSLRKGGASSAYFGGVPPHDIRRRGAWKAVETAFDAYITNARTRVPLDLDIWAGEFPPPARAFPARG